MTVERNCFYSHVFPNFLKILESDFFDPPLHSYLTNNMPGVERFPLSFQSQFSGNHFHHIVLGVHSGGRFGALGISRREDLMFKPLELRTLMDLVQEFDGAYRGYWHTLRKVRIGQYVSHDPHSVEQIEWKHSILDLDKLTKEELRKELERHTRDMRLKVCFFIQKFKFCRFKSPIFRLICLYAVDVRLGHLLNKYSDK